MTSSGVTALAPAFIMHAFLDNVAPGVAARCDFLEVCCIGVGCMAITILISTTNLLSYVL